MKMDATGSPWPPASAAQLAWQAELAHRVAACVNGYSKDLGRLPDGASRLGASDVVSALLTVTAWALQTQPLVDRAEAWRQVADLARRQQVASAS